MVHESQVLALDFSKEMIGDKLMLASGDQSGVIKVWKVTNGKCLRSIEFGLADGKGAVTVIRFMQNDTKIITVSADIYIRIVGLKSGSVIAKFESTHDKGFIQSLHFSKSHMLTCDYSGII